MEELYESEVMWAEESYNQDANNNDNCTSNLDLKFTQHDRSTNASASAPMSIPGMRRSCECCGDDEEGEIVPPHVMASRSRSGERMEFSMCLGQGRTLKGRDLKHVRNSILRMTGFLEV